MILIFQYTLGYAVQSTTTLLKLFYLSWWGRRL